MKRYILGLESNLKVPLNSNPKLLGLDRFRQKLEKIFFANVSVRNCSSNKDCIKLVIELNCNYGLGEAFFFLKNVMVRKTLGKRTDRIASAVSRAFKKFQDLNKEVIDIEELSIYLNETSIIVKRIYQNSLEDQLKDILQALTEHHMHFTKQFTEIPSEIYIPVFEEDNLEGDENIIDIVANNNPNANYLKHWGVYFDSEDDVVIYDLENTSLIYGDLDLLNH